MLNKRLIVAVGTVAAFVGVVSPVSAQFWTNQIANPVVLQVGDGTTTASGFGYSVTLKQYLSNVPSQLSASSTATFASNLALNSGNLVLSASATSEGNLTNSVDRNFVVLGGYDAPNNTSAVNSTTTNANRVVGFGAIGASGSLTGTATAYSNTMATTYNNNNIRSAVSLGGTSSDAWTGGTGGTASTGGVRYSPTNTQVSSTVTNVRSVDVYNGQLFTSSASGAFVGINAVGTGLQNGTGNTITNILATGGSPYEYVAYNDPTGSQTNLPIGNINRIYVADDTTTLAQGGIRRYSWNGSAFALDYVLNDSSAVAARGLAGYLDANNNAVLFYTIASGSQLREVIDTGSGSASLLLATADTNTVFRGVALATGITAVPEPTTYALLGMTGLVGSGVWFYRRRRATQVQFGRRK